ncbi:farnesyl-diphosphate synthase [Candidatus Marinamargulisbacteria bacterium SCGC AG-410-N11]|nr:farnesyl-diphosphate synthase [Candidatus Marinamargulisbacteria bacterium SCGC AG-410-N11]
MSFLDFSSQYKPIINDSILSYCQRRLDDSRELLRESIQYTLSSDAKRIRPLLSIASFLMMNDSKDIKRIMPFSVALEMFHTYSLIHDDLPSMDNDDYRRGRLTCHKKFGEDIAVLTGDILNTIAYEILARDLKEHYSSDSILDLISEVSHALGINGMVGGQVIDIKSTNNSSSFFKSNLSKMHQLKTGKVIMLSVVGPFILQNFDQDMIAKLRVFGESLGLLFQITDDLLDVTGTKEQIGKSPLKDENQNKLTYVSLYGFESAKKLASQEYEKSLNSLSELGKMKTDNLHNILEFVYKRTY